MSYFHLNLNPGNDAMCAILSLMIETLIYGLVIVTSVVIMMIAAIGLFCVDNPNRTETYNIVNVRDDLREGSFFLTAANFHAKKDWTLYHWFISRPFIHRVSFPEHFTKRAESLLDICFLVFPTLVVIFILIPTLGFLYNNEYQIEHLTTAFSIDVVGHQWYWSYEYHLGVIDSVFDFSFDSVLDVDAVQNVNLEVDRHVVIPTDVFVSITITSTDVIHSWAVPQLGIKVDAIPGRIANTVLYSFISGTFYGQCSELCGVLHGFMPICVESVPTKLFFIWTCLCTEPTLVTHNGLNINTWAAL
jgi:heme/copper-type cytochrome/quinol oxidase subunit 2